MSRVGQTFELADVAELGVGSNQGEDLAIVIIRPRSRGS